MSMRFQLDERGIVVKCSHCGRRNRIGYDRLGQEFRCGNCHAALQPPSEPVEVRDEAEFQALIGGSALPILVDFWADWCGPCKMLAPELATIAAEGQGRWLVAKINTEVSPALAGRFRISAIPTLMLFQSGREVARQSGAMPAAGIRQFLRQHQFTGATR